MTPTVVKRDGRIVLPPTASPQVVRALQGSGHDPIMVSAKRAKRTPATATEPQAGEAEVPPLVDLTFEEQFDIGTMVSAFSVPCEQRVFNDITAPRYNSTRFTVEQVTSLQLKEVVRDVAAVYGEQPPSVLEMEYLSGHLAGEGHKQRLDALNALYMAKFEVLGNAKTVGFLMINYVNRF